MSKIIRVYNKTSANSTWAGQLVSADSFLELTQSEGREWSEESDIMLSIANGELVINDGEKDFDATTGFKWLAGNDTPPRTKEGVWKQMNVPPSMLSGYKEICWTAQVFIEAGATYEEAITIRDGSDFILNWISIDSPAVESHSTLTFMQWEEEIQQHVMFSPCLCNRTQFSMKVDGDYPTSGVSTVQVSCTPLFDMGNIARGVSWNISNSGGKDVFRTQIVSANSSSKTIWIDPPSQRPMVNGDLIALAGRPIATLGTTGAPGFIRWDSPPIFPGDGISILKVTMTNTDQSQAGLVTFMANGYMRNWEMGE